MAIPRRAQIGILAAAYFVTAKLGLMLGAVSGFATLVWPPTGIALAALLLFGHRLWPGILIGAFLTNWTSGAPLLVACGMAIGNTLEAGLGASLLRRVRGFHHALDRVQDVLRFIGFAALLSTMVSATIGVSSLWLGRLLAPGSYGPTWRAWWVGDVLGNLVIGSLLLTWHGVRFATPTSFKRAAEAGTLAGILIAVNITVFGGLLLSPPKSSPFLYAVFLPLIWAALRFGPRGAASAIFATSVLAIWETARGVGPFASGTLSENLLFLQLFMGVGAVTILTFAAAIAERLSSEWKARAHEEEVRQLNERLEDRIIQRTAELRTANETLERVNKSLGELAAIVESSEVAMTRKTLDGTIVSWNKASERLYGYTAADIIGQPIALLVPASHQEELPRIFERLQRGETIEEHETVRICKDGRLVDVAVTISPIREDDAIVGASVISRDISERKQAERRLTEANALLMTHQRELLDAMANLKRVNNELQQTQLQLIQSAKMESVGRLAAGVAHEVKNPLATLLIGLDHLSDHFPTREDDVALTLQDMQRAVQRADTVIKGLLDFSSPHTLELAPHNLNDLMEQALLLVKHELDKFRIVVVKSYAADLPLLRLDRIKIEQVFLNLLTNAIDAMPEGGTLRLTTAVRPAAGSNGGAAGRRRTDPFKVGAPVVVVDVEDTGKGIPPERLSRVFDPFFTTKPTGKGTGLGLTVTKKIIELHGGAISLSNRKEGGVHVTLQLTPGGGDPAGNGQEAHLAD